MRTMVTSTILLLMIGVMIIDIKTLSNEDTPDYYDRAFETISKGIISSGTTQVDTVSGATYSSKGIINAVRAALNQAVVSTSDIETTSDSKDENAALNSEGNKQNSESNSTGGSNSIAASDNSPKSYKDRTYTGSGQGFGGITKVSVTIANGKITNVKTISNEDTSRYYNRAIKPITNSVISKQSGSVDTVFGATYSSKGIIEAVQSALNQAK